MASSDKKYGMPDAYESVKLINLCKVHANTFLNRGGTVINNILFHQPILLNAHIPTTPYIYSYHPLHAYIFPPRLSFIFVNNSYSHIYRMV